MDLKNEVAYRGVLPSQVKAEPGVSHNGLQLNGHVRDWMAGGGTGGGSPSPGTPAQPLPNNGYSSPLSSSSYGPYSPNGKIVTDCKKRWKSLRDQYNKKKKGESSSAESTSSNWEYMNIMSFLSDVAERRATISNCNEPINQVFVELVEEENIDEEQQQCERKIRIEYPQQMTDDYSEEDFLESEETAITENKSRATKRKTLEPITKALPKRESEISDLYENVANRTSQVKTPVQKFFESMADIVDKLPPNLQAEVRLKVCQIVTEIELKHHTHVTQQAFYSNLQSQPYNNSSNTAESYSYPSTSSKQHSTGAKQYIKTPMSSDD